MRSIQGSGNKAMSFGKSRAKLVTQDQTSTTFDDVAGVEEGYVLFGGIGAQTANISRIIIEGEVVPESMDSLAETRILQEAERLVP